MIIIDVCQSYSYCSPKITFPKTLAEVRELLANWDKVGYAGLFGRKYNASEVITITEYPDGKEVYPAWGHGLYKVDEHGHLIHYRSDYDSSG